MKNTVRICVNTKSTEAFDINDMFIDIKEVTAYDYSKLVLQKRHENSFQLTRNNTQLICIKVNVQYCYKLEIVINI